MNSDTAHSRARRADTRHDKGDPSGAIADVSKSIAWCEAQSPGDPRTLGVWYTTRARILQDMGDIAAAEDDIDRSIAWEESQRPRNERGLAACYSVRARVRQAQAHAAQQSGNAAAGRTLLAQARADVDRALTWWEKNLPGDERGLGILRADMARIEQAASGG